MRMLSQVSTVSLTFPWSPRWVRLSGSKAPRPRAAAPPRACDPARQAPLHRAARRPHRPSPLIHTADTVARHPFSTAPRLTARPQETRFTCLAFNASNAATATSGPVAPAWPAGSGCNMKLPYMQYCKRVRAWPGLHGHTRAAPPFGTASGHSRLQRASRQAARAHAVALPGARAALATRAPCCPAPARRQRRGLQVGRARSAPSPPASLLPGRALAVRRHRQEVPVGLVHRQPVHRQRRPVQPELQRVSGRVSGRATGLCCKQRAAGQQRCPSWSMPEARPQTGAPSLPALTLRPIHAPRLLHAPRRSLYGIACRACSPSLAVGCTTLDPTFKQGR